MEEQKLRPLTLFEKWLFCESYVRLLKASLFAERQENKKLQAEIEVLNADIDELRNDMKEMKHLFRLNKKLPNNYLYSAKHFKK